MPGSVRVERGTGTAIVLARIMRPYEPIRATAALLGLPQRSAGQLVGTATATSQEADDLLDAMPRILRSMAIATSDRAERCHGELRGPVLWSETMSVRSTSVGDPGLFVCATTTRAYDTAENRILKSALASIQSAGRAATHGLDLRGDDVLRAARHNEQRARHLLEHRTLSAVPIVRITGRMIRRTMGGNRRATYRPAVAVVQRAQDPLRAADIQRHASPATLADHDLLAAALQQLDARAAEPQPLINQAGGLAAGPLRYDHLGGVIIGSVLITSADAIEPALAQLHPGELLW